MKIIINERFKVECKDGSNYNLVETSMTQPKDGKEGKLTDKVLGHFGSTFGALKAYVDRSLDDCGKVEDVKNHVDSVIDELKLILNK
jgi:hypothetical protein